MFFPTPDSPVGSGDRSVVGKRLVPILFPSTVLFYVELAPISLDLAYVHVSNALHSKQKSAHQNETLQGVIARRS